MRGNGQIIQELEAAFRGAGWNVIKVIWGSEWDPLLAKDRDGLLVKRMGEVVDGEYQKYAVESGAYVRKHFWGADPRLLEMVKHLSDEQLKKLTLGGHDPVKVYNAYKAAVEHKGEPTVILARTIKGYGLGEAGEGKNITHQQKKLNEEELRAFRTRFGIPVSDDEISEGAVLSTRRGQLEVRLHAGAPHGARRLRAEPQVAQRAAHAPDPPSSSRSSTKGTEGRKASTTMVFVRLLSKLLRDKEIGKLVVPIVPDEARTFGMEALFRQVGIYSHVGQLYEPVDMDTLLYYKEATDGQILEEGINEAGSMSSFIAAGTAYATHGVNTIPFFIFYSMFGFQRVGDLIWAAADCAHARLPARRHRRPHHAGRRRAAAPGRQQPRAGAAGAELSRLRSGVRLRDRGDHPGRHQADVRRSGKHLLLPDGDERAVRDAADARRARQDGILKGMYTFQPTAQAEGEGAGAAVRQRRDSARGDQGAGDARDEYGVGADVWSVTSYGELYRDGHACERWNMLHPARNAARAVRDAVPERRARRVRRGVGLPEGAARLDRPLAAASAGGARHRRLRPQREPRRAARLLRGRPSLRRRRDAVGAGARRQDRADGGRRRRLKI